MIDELRELGYAIGWAQGATPPDLREKHREAGWAWEGDTHAHHDGEPIQSHDANAPGYVPEHRVLADDSGEPTVLHVAWPIGAQHSDGTPVPAALGVYVREDDGETWRSLFESHDERQVELDKLVSETPDETAGRHQREAEERAAAGD